ncbi:MAG: T9SS type A sorting domain-containing protein [Bacteroidetes bacterium]|nr:T9SS type A sorting domain-containing protein [Bacteroidota bacterium]
MTSYKFKAAAWLLSGLLGLALLGTPAAAQDDDSGLLTSTSWAGGGAGIVEMAHPSGDPCATPSTPGCLEYGGNTAWHDANVNDDYYISGGGGDGSINRLSRYIEATGPDQFEIRFTASGGLAVYAFTTDSLAAVPFEVWNIGDPDDGGDDIRMIPFLVPNAAEVSDWADAFTGTDSWPLGAATPITDWIYGMMPDRANGYDMFETAAIGFGGAGEVYDSASDGDVQIDPDPFFGGDCLNQGYYVDFCYRNQPFANNTGGGPSSFIYPIGRVVFADLAGDGTTPETGTIVRLIAEDTGFPNWAGNGAGIVESEHPTEDPCAGGDPGCADYFGNTVWHDPNVDGDFYVSGGGGDGSIDRLRRYVEIAAATRANFEIRFTAGGGFGVYGFAANTIVSVPFEVWAILPDGFEARLIPFINNNGAELSDWTDMYTGTDSWAMGGGTPITDWIYGMVPDRDNGYDLFEAAAIGFGGAGATYDPLADGDDQVDNDPSGTSGDGLTCDNQGYYVAFCFMNTVLTGTYPGGTFGSQFIYPIGRTVFADLAGDGTTPPEGTVISMYTNKSNPVPPPPPTDTEDSPETPQNYVLHQAYPNPFNPQAVVPFDVPELATVRLAVYDILGREVAVLVDGQVAAGRHEVVLDGSNLASGVYLIRMESAGNVQASMKVLLLR